MLETEVRNLLSQVSTSLIERGWRMATAESCTGGWIAKCCTDLPGSSEWFERGFVTYSNEAKVGMLGVDSDELVREGAVSRAVVEQMALGTRRFAPVDVGLAVTGIAGPDGGSVEKPVGTVWFAWSMGDRDVESEQCRFEGDRDCVRRQSVFHALRELQTRLERL